MEKINTAVMAEVNNLRQELVTLHGVVNKGFADLRNETGVEMDSRISATIRSRENPSAGTANMLNDPRG